MSQKSSIEWLDGGATWPVIRGCSKCSEGCDNCWAIRDAHLHAGSPHPKARAHFEGLTVIQNGRPNWSGTVRLDESVLDWPLRWKQPRKVFVASSADLFHERVTLAMRKRVFNVMREAPQHTYLILTKRAEEMFCFFRWWIMQNVEQLPANWWPGVSVENQQRAEERVFWLRKIPSSLRWISYEPALGPIFWEGILRDWCPECCRLHKPGWHDCPTPECDGRPRGINWVVIGGESGPGSRPFDLAWARNTITQCKAAGVPVFMKQMGRYPEETVIAPRDGHQWQRRVVLADRKGSDPSEWPEWARVREYPRV